VRTLEHDRDGESTRGTEPETLEDAESVPDQSGSETDPSGEVEIIHDEEGTGEEDAGTEAEPDQGDQRLSEAEVFARTTWTWDETMAYT
jgi:hypothetical protein